MAGGRIRLGSAFIAAALVAALAAPAGSEAGKLVVSTQLKPATKGYHLWEVQDDGTGLRPLTFTAPNDYYQMGGDFGPAWSPDGRQVLFTRSSAAAEDNGVWRVDMDGGPPTRTVATLTTGPVHWSPSGEWVAFTAASPPLQESDVFLMRPDGSGLRNVTNTQGDREGSVRFSDDGQHLIFRRGVGIYYGGPDHTMANINGYYSVRLDGSGEQRLTMQRPGTVEVAPVPVYSPDGRFFAFTNDNPDEPRLFTARSDGTEFREWPAGTSEAVPQWSPHGPTLFFSNGALGNTQKVDLSDPTPDPVNVTPPGALDKDFNWTEGKTHAVPDRTPPTAVLTGTAGRPLLDQLVGRAGTATRHKRRRVKTVSRDRLHFFAADQSGVRKIEVAIARVKTKHRCRFLGTKSFGRLRKCNRPVFRKVKDDAALRSKVARLRRGTYLLGFRNTDKRGNRTRKPRLSYIRLR